MSIFIVKWQENTTAFSTNLDLIWGKDSLEKTLRPKKNIPFLNVICWCLIYSDTISLCYKVLEYISAVSQFYGNYIFVMIFSSKNEQCNFQKN